MVRHEALMWELSLPGVQWIMRAIHVRCSNKKCWHFFSNTADVHDCGIMFNPLSHPLSHPPSLQVIVGIHDDDSYFRLKNKVPIDNTEKRMANVKKYVDQVRWGQCITVHVRNISVQVGVTSPIASASQLLLPYPVASGSAFSLPVQLLVSASALAPRSLCSCCSPLAAPAVLEGTFHALHPWTFLSEVTRFGGCHKVQRECVATY